MNRRSLIIGLTAALAAPAIVKASDSDRPRVASKMSRSIEYIPRVFDGSLDDDAFRVPPRLRKRRLRGMSLMEMACASRKA